MDPCNTQSKARLIFTKSKLDSRNGHRHLSLKVQYVEHSTYLMSTTIRRNVRCIVQPTTKVDSYHWKCNTSIRFNCCTTSTLCLGNNFKFWLGSQFDFQVEKSLKMATGQKNWSQNGAIRTSHDVTSRRLISRWLYQHGMRFISAELHRITGTEKTERRGWGGGI